MSIVGKGRGRGFVEVKETTLRRPGQPWASKFSDLINLIDNLAIRDITSGAKVDDIVSAINDSSKTDSLKEVFDDLHKQALEDRSFGMKLAHAVSDIRVYSINENSLRFILLKALQKDYEDREEIKKRSLKHFHNSISLLGEVYNSFILGGKPIGILSTPLLQYLEMLMETSEEEDIELATIQVSINGRKIYEQSPTDLEAFINRVRLVLIHRNLSAKSRGMLLYMIDLANQQFTTLTLKLQQLYATEVGIDTLMEIQRSDKSVIIETKLDNNVIEKNNLPQPHNRVKSKPVTSNTDENVLPPTMKSPRQGRNISTGAHEKSPPNVGNERVPRAIRGAGAADSSKDKNLKKSPRGKKDKLTDEQIWSSKQNTSSKVWGHDDRFDKDYN